MTNTLLFCWEYFIEKETPNLGTQNTFISISSNEAQIFVSFFNLLHFQICAIKESHLPMDLTILTMTPANCAPWVSIRISMVLRAACNAPVD